MATRCSIGKLISLARSCPLLELLQAHGAHLEGFQLGEAAQGTLTSSVRDWRNHAMTRLEAIRPVPDTLDCVRWTPAWRTRPRPVESFARTG